MNIAEWPWRGPLPANKPVGALLAPAVLIVTAVVLATALWFVRPQGVTFSELYTSAVLIGILLLSRAAWVGVRGVLRRESDVRSDAARGTADTVTMSRALLDALPDTVLLADREGMLYELGEGHSSSRGGVAATGRSLHAAYPRDIADRILRAVRETIDDGEVQTLEFALTSGDKRRYFETRTAAYRHDRALLFVRDITDRERAQQTIREAESKFRILVEQSLTGIYVIQDERFVYVNPRFAEVLGYTPEELLALESAVDVLIPEDRAAAQDRLAGLAGERARAHYVVRGLRKDATVVHAEVFRSVIEYNGKPAVIGTMLDVTEQREAQEQLRVLGMAVEQSAEGVLVIDTSGIVCFVNPAWARMHGYSVSEVTGHHFRMFHTEEQLRRDVFPVINRFEQTSIYRAEMGHKRKDGSTFMSSTAFASLRDDDGRVIGAVGICRDITEQKQYEAELLAAKEHAEELSRMKSAFLTNMSHEIRTPLTGILGFAKVLEDELPTDLREFAHLIQVSGDRLMNTLNAILDLARLEAGEVQPVPHDLDLREEVREAVTVFRAIAREKDLHFELYADAPSLPARVDRNMLNIILNNLLGNAVKFTDCGEIRVELAADEERVSIAVTDTGVGIDDAFVPHLFEEFKQESDGLTRSHEGSGLGLSITKRLVDLMDGDIRVESAKGEGSRFVVDLPRYLDRQALLHVA